MPMFDVLMQMLLKNIPADYGWDDDGIVRIGGSKDIAAYVAGDFKGPSLIFCHGNGETAVSEKYWFKKLVGAGVSIVCPDYRGYGLTDGRLSEAGCYEVAHAAYSYLVDDRRVNPNEVYVLGYSLGSAIAVELASSEQVRGLILQAPFVSGEELLKVWAKTYAEQIPDCVLKVGLKAISGVFPTSSRLSKITVPSLVIHGTSDEVIPYSQGEQVFKLLPSTQKRFIPVKNAGHNTFQYYLGDGYIRTLIEFMGLALPVVSEPEESTMLARQDPEIDNGVDDNFCALFEECATDAVGGDRQAAGQPLDEQDDDRPMCLYAAVPYQAVEQLVELKEKKKRSGRRNLLLILISLVSLPFLVWLAWWMGESL